MMQTSLLLSLALVTGVYLVYRQFLAVSYDTKEPPLVPQVIPVFGNVLSIMRKSIYYYVELRQRYSLPICTLAMPGSKLYIVNSTDLVSSIQRHPKTLAWPPIEAKFANAICASSKEASDIMMTNVNGDEGDWGYCADFSKSMHPALSPGPALDRMNRAMIHNIAKSLDSLSSGGDGVKTVKLNEWCRHEITLATTNAVYGPHNPFQDSAVEDAFWVFERDLMALMLNTLPALTAPKGHRSRKFLGKAFERYFRNESHNAGSFLVQTRYHTSVKNKIPLEDIARYEVGGSIAVLVNTVPAAFWMLFFVFSQPDILDDCRQEIATIMEIEKSKDTVTRKLDITSIKKHCPILASTFQEVLRIRGLGTSVRQVMQDVFLDNRYLLKKGATILMPSIVIHTDPSVWGEDVNTFNHKRFLRNSSSATFKTPSSAALRAFGGGSTLCPGRHFATTEVLSTVAMFIMRYECRPVSGRWVAPTTKNTNVAAVLMEPDTDIEIDVTPRKGFEDGYWEFGLQDSEMVFAVAAEDKVTS